MTRDQRAAAEQTPLEHGRRNPCFRHVPSAAPDWIRVIRYSWFPVRPSDTPKDVILLRSYPHPASILLPSCATPAHALASRNPLFPAEIEEIARTRKIWGGPITKLTGGRKNAQTADKSGQIRPCRPFPAKKRLPPGAGLPPKCAEPGWNRAKLPSHCSRSFPFPQSCFLPLNYCHPLDKKNYCGSIKTIEPLGQGAARLWPASRHIAWAICNFAS